MYLQVSGDVDSQAVHIVYWQQMVAISRRQGLRKVLVVDRLKNKPANPEELAQLAAMMQSHSKMTDHIAIVEPTAKIIAVMEHSEIEGVTSASMYAYFLGMKRPSAGGCMALRMKPDPVC